MSKNYKNYNNYNKYSNSNKPKDVVENTEPSVTAAPVEPEVTVINDPVVTPVETPASVVADPVVNVTDPEPTSKAVIGVVSNCKKLNVRADADMDAEIICVINAGDEVVVCELDGNDEWLEVHSIEDEPGYIGFHGVCVKKYITIKQ